ncbi:lytic murein transglycosylase [Pseudotabrizicola sediminis]|uniref:Lytic murein transglycosylase n=1 Tax=Pseudotabrizicola sediminis TaxID=2486418 RepID=A0ABY2KQ51_9RHOB|nr:lytic murein transglycosylase [Pseudotabrizicola sediminis]TGD44801.1 lytic murein transglycosylase [Pseudotabrizicola sediminis]
MRIALALLLMSSPAIAAPCGGALSDFTAAMTAEAVAAGLPEDAARSYLSGARIDEGVLRADRSQGVFRMNFTDFSRRLISAARRERGRALAAEHAAIFDRAEAEYGVPRGILLAFWAFETDYGAVQGDFNTRDALVTLSHDCRRPELFQPQILAAIALHAKGDLSTDTTGAWAGEIGMVQMLPADILARGVDGDGDGHVTLKTSVSDALLSGARLLQHHGWRAGQPWLAEVAVPGQMDWALSGLGVQLPVAEWQAMGVAGRETLPDGVGSLILPQGRLGPAFLAYPNFHTLFDWNQSFTYVLTGAYFATRLEGAPVYAAGNPEPGLDESQMMRLQEKLAALGHDVGRIDGILGSGTRAAVQKEQARLGMPADAWPTQALLDAL